MSDMDDYARPAGMDQAPAPEPERVIFKGGPSQVINYNTFAFCGFLFALAIIAPGIYRNALAVPYPEYKDVYMLVSKAMFFLPLIVAFMVWIKVYCHRYIITTERFKELSGVLSRRTEVIQLYRIKDVTLEQPFTLRMFGCGNVVLDTSDPSTPILVMHAVKDPKNLMDQLMHNVEIMRTRKGVREID